LNEPKLLKGALGKRPLSNRVIATVPDEHKQGIVFLFNGDADDNDRIITLTCHFESPPSSSHLQNLWAIENAAISMIRRRELPYFFAARLL